MRKVAFAAVAGRGKSGRRNACQDAVFGRIKGAVSCVALADGAGSRHLSGVGARRVVRVAVDYLVDNFDGVFEKVRSGDANAAASALIALLVKELGSPAFARKGALGDYACTLIFAAALDDKLLIGHLGDGFAFSVSGGHSEVASLPDNGEFSNETYFVTGPDAAQRFRFTARIAPAPQSVVLVSDGTGVSLFKRTDGSVASAVSRLCEWVILLPRREMNAVLKDNLQSVFCQKTMDDCSIAIMADLRSISPCCDGASGSSVS